MINFYCPINYLGYGIHSYNLMKELDKKGIDLALYPPNNRTDFTDALVEKWINNQHKFNKEDNAIMLYHEQFMNRFYGKIRIGYPVFELLPTKEDLEKMKCVDYLFQTSTYFKNVLSQVGITNVSVVPEGYDHNKYCLTQDIVDNRNKIYNERGIIFSHVGKYEDRKSSKEILEVFTYALKDEAIKCSLIVNMVNPFFQDWLITIKNLLINLGYQLIKENEVIQTYALSNLVIIVIKQKFQDIREIYNNSHFGIYLSKAEGWGLPLIESIASGLPCVTTNWTGQSEYLQSYPKELIVSSGKECIANDGIWFLGDKGTWVEPDLSSAKFILRNICRNSEYYMKLSSICRQSVEKFTWENSANVFIEEYSKISTRL